MIIQWGAGGDNITLPTAYSVRYVGAFSFRVWSLATLQISHAALCDRTLTTFKQDAAADVRDWITIGY